MTLKEYLHIRQNMLHNPAYLMGFGKQVRNEILDKMSRFARKHGLDVPGFSELSATVVNKSIRAGIVLKARAAKDLKPGQRWITIHPGGTATRIEVDEEGNEKEVKNYRRVLIDEDGKIVGGGVPREWQGRHISRIGKESSKEKEQDLETNIENLRNKTSHVNMVTRMIYKYVNADWHHKGEELVKWLREIRDHATKNPNAKKTVDLLDEAIDLLDQPSFRGVKRSRKYWEDQLRRLASEKHLPKIIEIDSSPSDYHIATGTKRGAVEYKKVVGQAAHLRGDTHNEFPMFYYKDKDRGTHGIYDARTGAIISEGKTAEDALLHAHLFFGEHGINGAKEILGKIAEKYGHSPSSPSATKKKEDGHKTSNQNILDAKSPDDEYDNRTPGPFSQDDVERFNRTTHYPITLEKLNRDHEKQTKEDQDKVLTQLKRWGIEKIPDDVQQALKKLTDARVHYTREMIRAREIAPPWTVTGRSKYQGKPDKARGIEERAKQQLADAKEHLEKVLKRHDPNRPISSDDPDAIERLQKKINKLEKEQESYKKINAIVRKKGLSVDEKIKRLTEEVGIGTETAKKLLEPAWNGDVGIPSFALENNRAEIKRLKERLEKLQNAQHESTSETEFKSGSIVDNVKDNRVQIFFDSKPSEDIRAELKKHGFKWAPSVGAWQRMRSNQALYWARKITGAEEVEKSMRSKEQWRDVKQRKEAEYGEGEYFADPAHSSYPLTVDGKPSRKRTLAAWRYINARRNAGKYTPEQLKRVKGRIKRFAKEHFGLELQDGDSDVKKSMWDYPFADDSQSIRDYVFSGVWKSEEDRKQWEDDIQGIRAMLEALRALDDARRHEEEEMREEGDRLVLRR